MLEIYIPGISLLDETWVIRSNSFFVSSYVYSACYEIVVLCEHVIVSHRSGNQLRTLPLEVEFASYLWRKSAIQSIIRPAVFQLFRAFPRDEARRNVTYTGRKAVHVPRFLLLWSFHLLTVKVDEILWYPHLIKFFTVLEKTDTAVVTRVWFI